MARNPNSLVPPPGHHVGESAEGPTRAYHVTPQRAGSYIDIFVGASLI